MFSLRGSEHAIHKGLYRSLTKNPTAEERTQARADLTRTLTSFKYEGQPLPETLSLSADTPVKDYFKQFPGLDASAKYNNAGFWDLPIPVCADVTMAHDDIVTYDEAGYPPICDFLKKQGVKHVILTGYATDMCFCKTTAGYENLSKDFNVFLVGDATLATFPANDSPKYATNAAISFAALNQLVTQSSWISLKK
jgi:nicotinamidase-related amidase